MQPRVVALANQKGGVGKTTTAINLAAALTILDCRVLLIDLDPQANATSGLGIEKTPGHSAYQALLGAATLADCVTATRYSRLDMVPSELDLEGAAVDIARGEEYLERLRKALEPLKSAAKYDLILIDCPPSLGLLTMNALASADGVLIPIQCEYYALEGLSVMSRVLSRLRGNTNPGLVLDGIVMTMYDARTNLSRQVVGEVRRHFAGKVFETLIPRTVRLGEAPSFGQPIFAYDPHSAGAEAYKRLAGEYMARLASATDMPDAAHVEADGTEGKQEA